MKNPNLLLLLAVLLVTSGAPRLPRAGAGAGVVLTPVGTYDAGGLTAAEIVAYDAANKAVYAVNAEAATVDVLDISDPSDPTLVRSLDVTPYGAVANSVAVHGNRVAVAVKAADKTAPGKVVFFDTGGTFLDAVEVGALPDMLTFTPDGSRLLVANEGEPNDAYTVDPEGSVTIIDLRGTKRSIEKARVRTVRFGAFNVGRPRHDELDPSIRVFGPNASVAQDLEPEYIAVSPDSRTAWVTLQEANAIAIIDIRQRKIERIVPLGTKDHSLEQNKLDASNQDDTINITTWPLRGLYQPDGIAAFAAPGGTFVVTANEGDTRAYTGFNEEQQVRRLDLDPAAFPDADDLQEDEAIGRLVVTTANGDTDGDGDFDELYAFGARSFSIWNADGELVFDSGDDLEQITAAASPDDFNSTNDENDSFDNRSDNKGPEPEGVVTGVIDGRTYAFIGLERIGGVVVYDVTDPAAPAFIEYVNNRDFSGDVEAGTAGDLGPEGLVFIPAAQSPNGLPLLVVGNEVSGTVTVYEITPAGSEG